LTFVQTEFRENVRINRIFPDFSGFSSKFPDFLIFSGFSQNYPDLSKCPDLFSSLSGFLSIFSGFFSGFLQKHPDFPGPKMR
jgi:hypothetical protein